MSQSHQLAAIMFTDIVGYTALMEEDEQMALETINTMKVVLTSLVKKHNGVFRKEIGDGTLSSFSSAVDAAQCAMAFQRSIQSESFKLRIGIHVGEVTFTKNDIYGDGVNIASRLESLAPPGGIFISGRVNEDIQNKTDINSILVGIRNLKNLSRPIKVFALIGEGLASVSSQKPSSSFKFWFNDLWERRFIQIISAYLVISYVVIQAIDAISKFYLLSPHWSQFSFVLLVSILPSIAVIAYYHGKGGLESWVIAEKVTLPVNAIFTAILLLFLFQGKQLGATTEKISVTNEEGKRIERTIARTEFRKRIAIFNFSNKSGDPTLDWWSIGIAHALQNDLYQDLFIKVKGPYDLIEEIKRTGKPKSQDLSVSLMRKIAQDYRLDYFIRGEFSGNPKDLVLSFGLYETENASLISQHELMATDPFEAIDQMTIQIKRDLVIPDSHISSTTDLPASSILTSDLDAYKSYIQGADAITVDNDYEIGIKHLMQAIQKDSEFAQAHLLLAISFTVTNQSSTAKDYVEKTMDHIYTLTERDQFLAKSFYYYLNEDQEKRIKVLRMWIEFYPEDVDAYDLLGRIFQSSGKLDQAKDIYNKVTEIDDDRGNFYVKLAEILEAQQNRDSALSYYQQYAEKYPAHPRSFQLLGNFYLDEGNFEMANQYFEKALLLDQRNINLSGEIALVKERMGRFAEALIAYQAILEDCKNPQDSLNIINRIMNFYFRTGQLNTGLDWWGLFLEKAKKTQPPLYVSMTRTTRLEWYMEMGRSEEALRILREEEEKFKDSFTNLIAFGYMNYYLTLKDIPQAEIYMDKVMNHVAKYGSPGNIEVFYQAELNFIKQNYQDALELFREFKKTNSFVPQSVIDIRIAKSLWQVKNKTEAIQVLEEFLVTDPYHPEASYELALLFLEQGKNEKALELLSTSLQVWESADLEYRRAKAARDKYDQLTSSLYRISD